MRYPFHGIILIVTISIVIVSRTSIHHRFPNSKLLRISWAFSRQQWGNQLPQTSQLGYFDQHNHADKGRSLLSQIMALSRRDVIIACVASFFAWGNAIHWFPILRWAGHAFVAGLVVAVLGLLLLTLLTSRGSQYATRNDMRRPKGVAFLDATIWKKDVEALRKRQTYESQALYPDSFIVSGALDELLQLIVRDFVSSWYSNISKNPVFSNEVDKTIRLALSSVRDRLLGVDLTEVVTTRIVPILTTHFQDFYEAERVVRGKNLSRNVTESEELDLAIASKYKEGKLHAAASLAFSDTKMVQQEHLRMLVADLIPSILPENVLESGAVTVLVKELVACAVLFPVIQMLSEPDTWNQIMEGYVRQYTRRRCLC